MEKMTAKTNCIVAVIPPKNTGFQEYPKTKRPAKITTVTAEIAIKMKKRAMAVFLVSAREKKRISPATTKIRTKRIEVSPDQSENNVRIEKRIPKTKRTKTKEQTFIFDLKPKQKKFAITIIPVLQYTAHYYPQYDSKPESLNSTLKDNKYILKQSHSFGKQKLIIL